jgi:hypothetical protein
VGVNGPEFPAGSDDVLVDNDRSDLEIEKLAESGNEEVWGNGEDFGRVMER